MKKLIALFIVVYCFTAKAQQAYNITLLAHWNDTTLERCDDDQIWNDLTGWHDSTNNREYIIAGSCDSIYFFDITDPTQIIKCDVEEGHSRYAINRDYDTYDHYVYCVSDRTSPPGSLQIFDLQYLPDSVHKVYDDDTYSINSHTLFIEATSKRLYLCTNTYKPAGLRSMAILSLADPENPTFLGELPTSSNCSQTHEVFVKHDTAYCSCGYNGLFIYDVTNPALPKEIGSIQGYPYAGFNHSSWMDSSGKYLIFSDELPFGKPIKIYDISDIANATPVSFFNSNTGATPHNAYWKGRFAWSSSYEDGVRVWEVSNPSQPLVAGYYDTYPQNAEGVYNGFHGCWGVYPFLPSGNIIASDISEGIFVLKPSDLLAVKDEALNPVFGKVFPNPVERDLHITVTAMHKTTGIIQVTDMNGRVVLERSINLINGENEFTFTEWSAQARGIYAIRLTTPTTVWSSKFMKP